ncbi:MAG: hypothetical protein LC795_15655 [Acidobacteria bacterium]|nr:hypothetical protein [Acidobacteriota bacterium]MCA1620711.1 hypothetical protein [Acidobacteriota bacterium]
MSENGFERLLTEGFLFEGTTIRGETLRASYGSGYGEGAVIGNPEGLRSWKVRVGALPNVEGENTVNAGEHGLQTRFKYLFDFFVRHNVQNARKPFWVRDPVDGRDYLAEIDADEMDFRMLSRVVMSTGLTLKQRRVFGQTSPGDAASENNQEI